VVKVIQGVAGGQLSKEDFKKAVALAKFKELQHGEDLTGALELTGSGLLHGGKAYQLDQTAKAIGAVTEEQVKKVSMSLRDLTIRHANVCLQVAKSLLDSKATVSTVGDLFVLPFAEDLGLKV
jgi:ubiquinol-cytochrome c reductase core subunit 2